MRLASGLILLLPSPVFSAGVPLTCTRAPFTSLPFCDASLPTSARVSDAVSRMPLSEKLSAMYRPFGSPFVTCGGGGGAPSLGISALPATSECVHGVAWGCTAAGLCPTLFPNGGALGAAFNRSLWRAVGSTIGDEQRALANLNGQPSGYSCWSPQLNLARDVRRSVAYARGGAPRPLRATPMRRRHRAVSRRPSSSRAGAARKKSPARIRIWSANLASPTCRE